MSLLEIPDWWEDYITMNPNRDECDMEYNKDIHCCRTFYKTYCKCFTEGERKRRDKLSIDSLTRTENFFKDINIEFEESNVQNVFKIKTKKGGYVFVSAHQQWGCFKLRFEGNSKWYIYGKEKFKNLF